MLISNCLSKVGFLKAKTYTVNNKSVKQGEFGGVAISPEKIKSNYMESFEDDFFRRIHFKFSINGDNNENPSRVNHTFYLNPVNGKRLYEFLIPRMLKLIIMNKIFVLICVSLLSANIIGQDVLNVRDFGISNDRDATVSIYQALQKCKALNAKKLIIPQGKYHFYPDKAFEKYCSITNNDNGLRRIAIPLIGFDTLEIDAQGSEFIFHGSMIPFVVEESSNITLKNFSIDFEKQFHLQGEVLKVDRLNKTFDLKISEENDYQVLEGELTFNSNGHIMNFQQNLYFNPETKSVVYNVLKYKIDPWNPDIKMSYEAEELDDHIVRIHNHVSALPKVGWILVAKGRTSNKESRYAPGIHVVNSKNINLFNINVYHAGAMGLVAERTKNMDLENFNVKLRNGSNRIISSTADATHFVNCRGDINITNCTFENMLDDGTNFHSVYGRVAGLEGRKKIGVRLVHYQQYGFDFADIGDSVRIIDPKSFYPIFSSKVESINKLNESYFEITLKDFLPKNISIDDAIENLSWHPENVDISHCIVKQNRARGFLINTRGKFEIRNNYFATMMEGVQVSSGLGFFSEAGSVDDVLIENNIFDNCSNSGYGNAVININPHIEEFIPEQDYYHHNNIRIIGNTINHFDNLILNVFHSNHVLFKKNQINKTAKYPPLFLDNPTIKMSHCKDAKVCGNKFIGFDYKLEATVEQSVNVHLQSSIKHKQ